MQGGARAFTCKRKCGIAAQQLEHLAVCQKICGKEARGRPRKIFVLGPAQGQDEFKQSTYPATSL